MRLSTLRRKEGSNITRHKKKPAKLLYVYATYTNTIILLSNSKPEELLWEKVKCVKNLTADFILNSSTAQFSIYRERKMFKLVLSFSFVWPFTKTFSIHSKLELKRFL